MLDALLADFSAHLQSERGVSQRTARFYATDARHFAAWLETQKPSRTLLQPDGVTHLLVRRYLSEVGRGENAIRTVRRRVTSLRALWRWFLKTERGSRDPLAAIEPPRLSAEVAPTLSVDDVTRLLESVSDVEPSDLRDRAILELFYGTGARASEVSEMQLDDFDARTGSVRLGSGARERRVPLGREGSRALRRYLERGREALQNKAKRTPPRDEMWLSERGLAMSPPLLYVMARSRGAQVGLEVSPHALRRACAVHLLEAGAEPEIVAQMLGLGGVAALQGYLRETPVKKRQQSRAG